MPKRILVVDDNPFILELVKDILSTHGFEILTATDVNDALRLVVDIKPCLLILDICLPGMDGWEVLKRVKNASKDTSINILIISSLPRRKYQSRALELGADYYLEKPFGTTELLRKVNEIISGSR